MALDPRLSKILSGVLKNHINDMSNSNESFRQQANAHNSYLKNIVGQIHKAIGYNRNKFSRASSDLDSTSAKNNETVQSVRNIAQSINSGTFAINQMINEIRASRNIFNQSINSQGGIFNNITNTLTTFNKRAGGLLGTIGTIGSLGALKGTPAKVAGGIAMTGAAAYTGYQINESLKRMGQQASESAAGLRQGAEIAEGVPGPGGGAPSGRPSGSEPSTPDSTPTPSRPPSGTQPPSEGTPSPTPQTGAQPPSDARRTETPNIIGGFTSTSQIPQHGGSKFSREFGFYRDTSQGRVPIRGGRGHAGLDIPIKTGQPYKAHMDGTVINKGFDRKGYGHYIDVKMSDGSIHRFSHMGTNDGGVKPFGDFKVGQPFKKGDVLGYGGYSGNATSDFPHVHHEVWRSRGKEGERGYQSADELYDKSKRAGGSRAGMQFRSDPRKYWEEVEEKERQRLEQEKQQSKPQQDGKPQPETPPTPDAARQGATETIPNPYKPGEGLAESRRKPFGMVLSHMSGFTPGSESPEGAKVRSTTEELEFMKKGFYKKGDWRSGTGFGYHTAVASTFVNPETGQSIDETAYGKLSESEKRKYVEQAQIHEIRPHQTRPFQAKGLNEAAYGIATVGKLTPAKIEAMKNHLAKMYANGLISKEALQQIYGHGELQTHGGRGKMQPGGEGAPMARALRESLEEILKRGDELKNKQQQQPAPIKTDAIPSPEQRTETPATQINRAALDLETEESKRTQMATKPTEQPTMVGSRETNQNEQPINPNNNWAPNLRAAMYIPPSSSSQQSVAV